MRVADGKRTTDLVHQEALMVRLGLGYSMLILGAANLALGAYQMFVADLLNNENASSIQTLTFSLCLIYVGNTWIRPERTTSEPCR